MWTLIYLVGVIVWLALFHWDAGLRSKLVRAATWPLDLALTCIVHAVWMAHVWPSLARMWVALARLGWACAMFRMNAASRHITAVFDHTAAAHQGRMRMLAQVTAMQARLDTLAADRAERQQHAEAGLASDDAA